MSKLSVGQQIMFKDKWNDTQVGVIAELNKAFPTVDEDGNLCNIYLTVVECDLGIGYGPSRVAIRNSQIFN